MNRIRENDNTEKIRVLIVDDVEANRFLLRDIIQEMDYQPILTENGVQALRMVERLLPKLIILDVAMPEMDGYEFCQIMKDNPKTRDIPIIFISAFDDPEDVVKGFNLGGEDYITKPFIPEVVKARVSLHLKLANAGREMKDINRLLQKSVSDKLRQIETEKKNILHALICVAKETVSYDQEYMERLCYNCRILAEAMQLSPKYDKVVSDQFIDIIEQAAPLCDLGNVAVPTEILQKTEPLEEGDCVAMQQHTIIGAKILEDIQKISTYNDFIQMSMEIAHYHHENWDGSGYPCGKSGDDIPLPAQIVAISDAFCSLTGDGMGAEEDKVEEALKIMQKDVRHKFNPDIFDILCKIYRQLH